VGGELVAASNNTMYVVGSRSATLEASNTILTLDLTAANVSLQIQSQPLARSLAPSPQRTKGNYQAGEPVVYNLDDTAITTGLMGNSGGIHWTSKAAGREASAAQTGKIFLREPLVCHLGATPVSPASDNLMDGFILWAFQTRDLHVGMHIAMPRRRVSLITTSRYQ
jgi:hypothetical protein